MKARTVVGRGEKSLLSDLGSELRLGEKKEKEQCEDKRRDGQKRKMRKHKIHSNDAG